MGVLKPPKHKKNMKPMEKAKFIQDMGRYYASVSRAPLKKEGTGDAWNERQNRLAASNMAVQFLMDGIMLANKLKQQQNED